MIRLRQKTQEEASKSRSTVDLQARPIILGRKDLF